MSADLTSCLQQIPAFTEKQPNALFWSDWRGGCKGTKMEINPLTWKKDKGDLHGETIGRDDIDSVWTPPNIIINAGTSEGDHNDHFRLIKGNETRRSNNFSYPGLINDLNVDRRDNEVGTEDINWVTFTKTKNWDEHLADCCAGSVGDERLCGKGLGSGKWYEKGGDNCKTFLQRCEGADIIKNGDGSALNLSCYKNAKENPKLFDDAKVDFCKKKPNHSLCRCINLPNDPEYTKWTKMYMNHFQGGAKPDMLAFSAEDGTNVCRDNVDNDLNGIFIPSSVIERKNDFPSQLTLQDLSVNVSGDNNMLNDVTQSASAGGTTVDGKTGKGTGGPSAAAGLAGMSSGMLMFIVFVFVVVFGIIIALMMRGGGKKHKSKRGGGLGDLLTDDIIGGEDY